MKLNTQKKRIGLQFSLFLGAVMACACAATAENTLIVNADQGRLKIDKNISTVTTSYCYNIGFRSVARRLI